MNKNIIDILDYVLVEYESLTTVEQCNYILKSLMYSHIVYVLFSVEYRYDKKYVNFRNRFR